MKILFCANVYETGIVGPGRLAENLLKINDLYPDVHEIRIVTADVKNEIFPIYKMDISYPKFLRIFDVLLVGVTFLNAIKRIRKEFKFDVLVFGNAVYGVTTKMYLADCPVFGFVNDYHSSMVGWENFLTVKGGISLFLNSFFERYAVKKLDGIIVCSDYIKSKLLRTYQPTTDNIQRLYQSVNLRSISYSPRCILPNAIIKILFVKRRYDIGRLQDLATALALLPKYKFLVTVLGPEKEHATTISNYFQNIGHAQVEFLGPSPQSMVHEKMATHHILCIPSVLEGQGLANIEGMAHGISVVSTRVGGITEVLDGGNNGWLCEPCSPASLADALEACILTPDEERAKILGRARKFAETHFDYPLMLQNFLEIIHSVQSKTLAHAQ